ncbi:MAG: IS3 family transposase [Candidatus Izemoplasmatales bacterium]|jgi:transposase InsO family protein
MKYTIELKSKIIELFNNGMSITMLSKEFNIPRTSIYHWIDLFVEKPVNEFSLTKRNIYDNQIKLERLELINTIQHYVISNLLISKERKLELVYLLAEKSYPIKTICRILGIETSTFYHDKNRKPEVYLIDEQDDKFKPLIQSIFTESNGRFGGRKIRIQIVKDGHIISHLRVVRLMKEMGLKPNQPDDNYNNYHKRKWAYKPNIISKSECYPEINKIWVSDITFIRVRKEHYYLIVIIDLYSRKVIGHQLARSLGSCELIEIMKETYHFRRQPNNLIFHSDQGLQYTALAFKAYLKENNITQSFSKKGCPYDNSVAESFFASLKKEEIYRHIYNSYDHLKNCIDEYVVFYNEKRPHASLRYSTPDEFEFRPI